MNQAQFWAILDRACESDPAVSEEWDSRITAELVALQADEIVEWNHLFDRSAAQACTADLWGAAYLINGGASDDGFYYFRCWLIGMGEAVYEAALANPDTLADRVSEGMVAEAEIYAAAHNAWMKVTRSSPDDDYPARDETALMTGDRWDFDDVSEARRRLPRLSTIFLPRP